MTEPKPAEDRPRLVKRRRADLVPFGKLYLCVERNQDVLGVARPLARQPGRQPSPASRGSRISRRPSPKRLKPSTASVMAPPGASASHGSSSMKLRASLSMLPHDGAGGWTPSPRNDRAASIMM